MTVAAWHVLAVVAFLEGSGWIPTLAWTRDVRAATLLAPLMTGVVAAGAAILAVALRATFLGSLLLVLLVAHAAAIASLRRSPINLRGRHRELPLLAIAVVAVAMLGVRRAAMDWDARSIWFLHAQWFWRGGEAAAAALGNPALVFSQADYPPLVPATIGSVWSLFGGFDPEVAQLTVALLGASALLGLALAVDVAVGALTRLRRRGPIAALAAAGAVGIGGSYLTNGYADVVWSVAFVGGAALLLLGPTDRTTRASGCLILAAAMLTKNEGMVAGLVVLAATAVRDRRRVAWAMLGACAAPALVWTVLARVRGAESYLATSGRLGGLLARDPIVTSRLDPSLSAFWAYSRDEVVVALIVTLVAAVAATAISRWEAAWRLAAVWGTFGVLFGSLLLAYLISPYDISWHLSTSIDRTTIAPRVWLLTSVAIFGAVLFDAVPRAIRELRHGSGEEPAAEPQPVERQESVPVSVGR